MRIKLIIVTTGFIVLMYPAYLWMTYIDNLVTTGSAYGFNIGSNKADVYKSLPLLLSKIKNKGDSIFIQIKSTNTTATILATKSDFEVMIKPLFHDVGYSSFSKKDTWVFYINGSFFNTLKLKFCEEKLCKIYRHRKYFEFP